MKNLDINKIIESTNDKELILYELNKLNSGGFLCEFLEAGEYFNNEVYENSLHFKIDKNEPYTLLSTRLVSRHLIISLLAMHYVIFSDINDHINVCIRTPNKEYNEMIISICVDLVKTILQKCKYKNHLNLPTKHGNSEILWQKAKLKVYNDTEINDSIHIYENVIQIEYDSNDVDILSQFIDHYNKYLET